MARVTELQGEVSRAVEEKPILFLATPAYGCMVTTQYLKCILNTQIALRNLNFGMLLDTIGNESLITRARNVLTKRFLMSQATHLLFIDADISWHPEAILRLLQKNEGVVTSCYPKKYLDWTKIQTRVKDGGDEPLDQVGLDFNLNVTQPSVQVREGFLEVLDAATGFMLVKREVLEKMYEHYKPELFAVNDLLGAKDVVKDYVAVFDCMIDPETKRPLSEDYAFSRRWQALGGEVHMDIGMPLSHTGSYAYEGDIASRLQAGTPVGTHDRNPVEDDRMQKETGKKTVLVAMLPTSDDKVSVYYVQTMTQLVSALQNAPNFSIHINLFKDKNEACDHAFKHKYDTLLMLDGMVSFHQDAAVEMLNSASPFQVGVHPECTGVQWSRLVPGSTEDIKTQGYNYHVEMVESRKDEAITAPLGFAKIDRCVLERISSRLDPHAVYCGGERRLWFHDGVMDDRRIDGDEMFCRMWGEGVTLHTRHPVTRMGNMTFSGSVLMRKKIR